VPEIQLRLVEILVMPGNRIWSINYDYNGDIVLYVYFIYQLSDENFIHFPQNRYGTVVVCTRLLNNCIVERHARTDFSPCTI